MTAHNVRLTLQKLSRSAFLLTQSCDVGMSRPRGKRSGSRRVASGGSDSSLCEALFVQIDISRLDSVSRLGVFMHCLVFSQVSPRHFVQQSTTLRREHIVAVKKPTTEPNLPLPRGDPRLNR